MIERIVLRNIKCFRQLDLPLSQLTILAGLNGAGKSTVVQALLMVRQSFERDSLRRGRIDLMGDLADVGTASEVYCREPESRVVAIELYGRADGVVWAFESTQSDGGSEAHAFDGTVQIRSGSSGADDDQAVVLQQLGIAQEPFNYLHAERLGPRKVFDIGQGRLHALSVGSRGELAPSIVAGVRRDAVVANPNLLLTSDDGKEYNTLHYQWPLWMARIFPGFEADSVIYREADQVRIGLSLYRGESGQPVFVRPTNTGFGISYVLGVVVAALVGTPSSLLVVENPEAHLHPRAQSAVGELLARAAAGGTQVIVETHSEHVLNGARRMVNQGILRSDNAQVHFFGRVGTAMEPAVTALSISPDGSLSGWPTGFFDQLDSDLLALLD